MCSKREDMETLKKGVNNSYRNENKLMERTVSRSWHIFFYSPLRKLGYQNFYNCVGTFLSQSIFYPSDWSWCPCAPWLELPAWFHPDQSLPFIQKSDIIRTIWLLHPTDRNGCTTSIPSNATLSVEPPNRAPPVAAPHPPRINPAVALSTDPPLMLPPHSSLSVPKCRGTHILPPQIASSSCSRLHPPPVAVVRRRGWSTSIATPVFRPFRRRRCSTCFTGPAQRPWLLRCLRL